MNIPWNEIIGGFGLFMFGIKFMGDGLKSVTGDKLRDFIDKYTSKPIMAVLIGIVITVLVQSSSATTAITIGLVRAGLMKLEQAAGIVMGANIGTTVTSFLIGLDIEQYSLYFVCIGALLYVFANGKKMRYIGEIVLGFGLLFYGLTIMGDALKLISKFPEFESFAKSMTDVPLLGLLAGTLMTATIQSSSAVIGIVQKIYETNIDILPFTAVLPFVFGSNIGTTITGILAALGGSLAAKRTAAIHTFFNVVGTIIAMICLYPFANLILHLTVLWDLNPMMQIAVAHIIFNLITTVVFFPFLTFMCKLIKRIIPGNDIEIIDVKVDDLDPNLAHTLPGAALDVSKNAIMKLKDVTYDIVIQSRDYLNAVKPTNETKEIINQTEALINNVDKKITSYLVAISKENLTDEDVEKYSLNLEVIKNYERIGDLSVNLAEFYEMINEDKTKLSKTALNELNEMYDIFIKMFNLASDMYFNNDISEYDTLIKYENLVDHLEFTNRQNHFKRMSSGECTDTVASSVYCDILGVIERMSDHTCNIVNFMVNITTRNK